MSIQKPDDRWEDYSDVAYNLARDRGDVTVTMFPVYPTLSCALVQNRQVSSPAVQRALEHHDVVGLWADIWATPGAMARFESYGLKHTPKAVVCGPGLASCWTCNSCTPWQLARMIEKARGGTEAI